jgi:diguanylate cyclase
MSPLTRRASVRTWQGAFTMAGGSEHEHSMVIAAAAFDQMKALGLAATPHNYEVWYNYANATNPSLNQTINDLVASRGSVTQTDIDELFEKYFSPSRLTDQIDVFGSQVKGEIDQIITFIDGTLDSTMRHSVSLTDMSSQIDATKDLNGLRDVIGRLVQTAKAIESANQKFGAHLKESREEINQLQKHLEAVRTEILTDPLTTLSNRKLFDKTIVKAIAAAHANATPLTLVMTDIDHFKRFNDTYGHLTGDQVLRLVALSLKRYTSGRAVAARYGGEEFAIILPDIALPQAATLADQIRRAVMGRELKKRSTGQSLGHVTISLGIAALRPGDTLQSLIERADNCLYAAKHSGRNRVVCENDAEFAGSPAKVA